MTLLEISQSYQDSANAIHTRIVELRNWERGQRDIEEARQLRRRIAELMPLWREMRELAVLTGRYYDRSYHKNERYSF